MVCPVLCCAVLWAAGLCCSDGFGKGNTGVPGQDEDGPEALDPRDPDYEGEEEEAEKPAPKAT